MLISLYLFRQTASALVAILISLTLIVWLTSVLKEVSLLTSEGQTFILFLEITALAIPNLIVMVAPVAFLIASLYTLNKLAGDSELIVLSAAGASVWRIFAPYAVLAVLVFLGVMAGSLFVMPRAARLLADLTAQIRADVLSQVLRPGAFSELEPGLTFHMRNKSQDGELLGVVVRDERDPNMTTTVIGERGVVVKDGERATMKLFDGQILRQEAGKQETQIVAYATYAFDLADLSPKQGPRDPRPRERDIDALLFPGDDPAYKANPAAYRSELHERLSAAIYALAFVVVAVLYLGRPRTTREGRGGLLFTAFLICAALRVTGIAGVNIVGKQSWALLLIYGLPAFAALAGLIMLRFNVSAPSIGLPRLRLPFAARFARGGSA
ncbi:MAG: LptF/LptG family permease [Rhodomicrobium sp.]|jgi:lipopolysaccharide export system permease protein